MRQEDGGQLGALPQSFRFLLAGGSAAAVNWLVRFPLSAVMPFSVAVIGATLIGMVFGFVTYRTFVFPGSSRRIGQQLRDFVLVNLMSLAVVTVAATLFRDLLQPYLTLQLAEALSHAIGITIGAVLNYIAHSAITFQNRGRG
jgi:putative flippase GtrA